jgi:hypothetical protein
MITDKEIQFVKEDLAKGGVDMPGLDNDLLDHLLCSTEAYMAAGHSFMEAYRMARTDLHGTSEILEIQQTTISELNSGRRGLVNLLNYCFVLGGLILVFSMLTSVNPALILVCISLVIYFIYHGIFSCRKGKSHRSNFSLFLLITAFPVIGVIAFLIIEFPSLDLVRTPGWCILIVSVAITVYKNRVKTILQADSSALTFYIYTFKFIAMASFLWIPLALTLRLFAPHAAVYFFLDELLILCVTSLSLSQILPWLPDVKRYLMMRS